jgi:hypothetical protein
MLHPDLVAGRSCSTAVFKQHWPSCSSCSALTGRETYARKGMVSMAVWCAAVVCDGGCSLQGSWCVDSPLVATLCATHWQ